MDEWYLLKAKPRQEQRAVFNLEAQGFESYCPYMKKKGRKPEPLFPGYLFLRCAADKKHLPWQRVRSTRGVQSFVQFGPQIATVPEELVDQLLDREDTMLDKPVSPFKPGQKVTVVNASFHYVDAIYQCDKGAERCIILMKMLNRETRTEVPLADLQA